MNTTKPTTYTYAVTLPCGKVSTLVSRRIYRFAVIGFSKHFNHYAIFSHHAERKHAEASVRNQISWGETEVQIVSL